ncbi:MAG: hypothetical protein ABFD50_00405 [Smithella sp.]
MSNQTNIKAALAASLQPYHAGADRRLLLFCVITAAVRPGTPVPPQQVSATQIYNPAAFAVMAGQGKKRNPDQNNRVLIGLVRVVRAVRAKLTTPRAYVRARVYEYYFLSYSFFFSIKENTQTTLTEPMTVGFFALTKHPDQA